MNKPFQLLAGVVGALFSLIAMVVGIVLTNSVSITFWRMVLYDMAFVLQFLAFLWCAVVFTQKPDYRD